MIEAGKCYIIKPGYSGNTGTLRIGDEDGQELKGPYYMIDRVSYDSNAITPIATNDIDEAFTFEGTDCSLDMKGSYEPTWIPKYAYQMFKSELLYFQNDYYSKGYCWWIEDKHQMGTDGQPYALFMSEIKEDETTGIIKITLDQNGKGDTADTDDNVYNLQGQKMSRDTALPRGIYITNGKKFVVK